MSFELHGRDEENVPILTGAPEIHMSGPWLFSFVVGLFLSIGFVLAGLYSIAVQHDFLRFIAAVVVAMLLSGSVAIGSLWWFRLARELPNLASLEEMGIRFGVDVHELRGHARDNRIRPRVKVNGEDLYRPRDFGDPASLLRPSSGPSADPTMMLRTSEGGVNPDHLPRPASELSGVPESSAAVQPQQIA